MISKEFHYYFLRVKELESDTSPLELVPIVKDFPEVFLDDLPKITPEREIYFCIDCVRILDPYKSFLSDVSF